LCLHGLVVAQFASAILQRPRIENEFVNERLRASNGIIHIFIRELDSIPQPRPSPVHSSQWLVCLGEPFMGDEDDGSLAVHLDSISIDR
jgi:hypothetical protein